MDNRIFNVNGQSNEELAATLKLAFQQGTWSDRKAIGYANDPKKGLVLFWAKPSHGTFCPFPSPLTAERVLPLVQGYLESDEAKNVPQEGWDRNADHDGENRPGWRIYCEDWGHVGGWEAFIAIRFAWMWLGK